MKLPSVRNAFISGLLLLAPVGVTLFVIKFLVDRIGAPASKYIFWYLPPGTFDKALFAITLNVVATLYVLALITLLGWFSQIVIGRFLVQWVERFVTRVPFVNTVYNTVKQIVDTFSQQKKAVFQECVLVQFPREGIWAMGFLTGQGKGEVQARTSRNLINIFLPTTPNPTSGYLIMVPEEDLIRLDMNVADGMKLIISGGAVAPPWNPSSPSDGDASEGVPIQNPPSPGSAAPPEYPALAGEPAERR